MACLPDTIEEAAKEAVGNWKKFNDFGWHDRPDWAEEAFLFYVSNRDSELLDQANAKVWEEEMGKFGPNQVTPEHHGHWAVGFVDGYAIRVRWKNGSLTPAFKKWYELQQQIDSYPVLDEDLYSQMESDAFVENIESAAHGMVKENPPEGWAGEVASYLWDKGLNCCTDNRDDSGGWPCDNHLMEALMAKDLIDEDMLLDYMDSHPQFVEAAKEYFSLTGPFNPDTVRNCEKHGCSYLPGSKCPKCS